MGLDLESNLAAAVECLDDRVDSDEEGSKEGGKEGGKEATLSNENTGGQDEAESDKGKGSAALVPQKTVWLAEALLAEGRESRESDKTLTETSSKAAEETQGGTSEPIQPRKRGRPRGSVKKRGSSELRRMRDTRGKVLARLLRADPKPRKPRRSTLLVRNIQNLRGILKSTSRMLKATGTWTEAPTPSVQGQELESTEVTSNTDESDEDDKTDVGNELDGETTTAPIPKYKKQIADTFRPWVAHQDEKIIPSACGKHTCSCISFIVCSE
jgi:hypothetical protein